LLVNAGLLGGVGAAQHYGLIDPQQAAVAGSLLLLNRMGSKALNSRALAMGESKALKGLARSAKPLPRLLPAAVPAARGLLATDPNDPENILPLLQGY
jgi:hypothetical protein